MFNFFFFKSCRLWDNVEKYWRPQMTTWCMRIECWMPKATNTPSECVIIITFPLQQWSHKRVFVLRYTYIVYFIFPFLLPYAVWTETSDRYIQSNDIKCIKLTKNDLYLYNVCRTFDFLKWRGTLLLIQDTKHFRIRMRSECVSVWVGGMRIEYGCWENLLESTRKTEMTLVGVYDIDFMK